ncbi:peptidase U32 [Eubacterium ramulus]|jgi:U32 family peptidase|uniref:Peptidase U32 n=1 Tax=Eubacterium ramulus TaxID=39490 RepID=A0A2V1JSC6_EUBRA|nr:MULTISPECIES: U32 family peptidase [Clostridia]MBS5191358.1 U32 family peptidase [Lachnospiraceae bacterium]PWE86654.1 peptidase U32 [Eubacterium ramulus]RHV71681.1 U32 family peptidase [Roseburia sp. OM02-15]
MKHPELLIPASSLEVLKTAVVFGADAVYIGGEAFGLRAKAKNFSMEEIREGIAFAHAHDVKVYITANILAHNGDLSGVRAYFEELKEIKPDALIISDPGVFMIAREVCPEIDIHISTQANNTNYGTYQFWHQLGARRVVTARELSMAELKEIREKAPADLEMETFIHGAMCISYSGRCLLSNYFTGRDANRGACTHPCRWKYAIVEETRPGEYMPVYENERGTYIFNSKDLCMIEHIPELIDSGIDSFKIEGRMKTALYVATVARTYRKAIDDYLESPELYRKNMDWYLDQISNCTYRQFTTGFFFGKPDESAQIYDNNTYVKEYTYLGIIGECTADGLYRIEQRNKFSVGEQIEIMKPDGRNIPVVVRRIVDEEGQEMQSAPHPKQVLYIELAAAENGALSGAEVSEQDNHAAELYDILRRKEEE